MAGGCYPGKRCFGGESHWDRSEKEDSRPLRSESDTGSHRARGMLGLEGYSDTELTRLSTVRF